ncbi:hypothetical protein ACFLZV_01135 [Candidatus Margulisiibacteriota bacterium]
MKIILFRFEKEQINILRCDINSGNLNTGKKEKISLQSTNSRGEKYLKILNELSQIQTSCSTDFFAYQSPQKYRGAIKDEEGFANTAILHLFCEQKKIKLLELTPPTVRKKLSIPDKEFKTLLEKEKKNIYNKYSMAKSDKLLDGLTFLSLLRHTF